MVSQIAVVAQAASVIAACWAIISGVGAWKREFLGKRRIELAEDVLAAFFEVKDAIAFIRSGFSQVDEGRSRKRQPGERTEESELLDQAYVVFERFQKRESVFTSFATLKYRSMAAFGADTESIFADASKVMNEVFVSSRMLGSHYWPRQGRVAMTEDEFQEHLKSMRRHEDILWDGHSEADPIRIKLEAIQSRLDTVVQPVFEEPIGLFAMLTKKRSLSG